MSDESITAGKVIEKTVEWIGLIQTLRDAGKIKDKIASYLIHNIDDLRILAEELQLKEGQSEDTALTAEMGWKFLQVSEEVEAALDAAASDP